MNDLIFKFLVLSSDGYIDPHSGMQTSGFWRSFGTELSTTLTEVYGYIQGFYWITIGLVVFAFIFSVCRYAMSSINNSFRLRDEAKSGMLVSLGLLAFCGAVPFVFSVILTLINFFRV